MEEEEACLYAMKLSNLSILPMTLTAAIDLGVLDLLAKDGSTHLSPKEIASGLGISSPGAYLALDRILRFLASHDVVACSMATDTATGAAVRLYGPNLVSKYLTKNKDGFNMLGSYALLLQGKLASQSMCSTKEGVERGEVPFEVCHGAPLFEYISRDPELRELFYKGMSGTSMIAMRSILESYRGFEGLKTVVDVGGGHGTCIAMITSKYPHIHGINFDLPHVVSGAASLPGIEHVGGDMYEFIPQGDAIFMKWILHNWDDEHCIKLLKNCWKALPCNGKVIIAESILPEVPESNLMAQYSFQMDLTMFTYFPDGKVRTEREFDVLRKEAGFSKLNVAYRSSSTSICIIEMEK